MKNRATDRLDEVDRRFGRISGTLALVYIAVFAKFGLWQALTERCCGMVETAGVGGVFWKMDGLWCGMVTALVLALPLAFLQNGVITGGKK